MLNKNERNKNNNKKYFDRINYYLEIQKEKIKKGESPEKIKKDIIKIFKEEKSTISNILQKLLKEQVIILEKKIELFKKKEYYSKEEIEKHNLEINEIQKKINIIYERSHKHINRIMEELNELLEKMDENFSNLK